MVLEVLHETDQRIFVVKPYETEKQVVVVDPAFVEFGKQFQRTVEKAEGSRSLVLMQLYKAATGKEVTEVEAFAVLEAAKRS